MTPGDSHCSSSVLQLRIVGRSRVTPDANAGIWIKPDNFYYVECLFCYQCSPIRAEQNKRKRFTFESKSKQHGCFYKNKVKERCCGTGLADSRVIARSVSGNFWNREH